MKHDEVQTSQRQINDLLAACVPYIRIIRMFALICTRFEMEVQLMRYGCEIKKST